MKRQEKKKRGCLLKVKYGSFGEAERALECLKKYRPDTEIYKCKFCRCWHIGGNKTGRHLKGFL